VRKINNTIFLKELWCARILDEGWHLYGTTVSVSTVNLRQRVYYCALCLLCCVYMMMFCVLVNALSNICAAKQIKPLLYLLFKTSSH